MAKIVNNDVEFESEILETDLLAVVYFFSQTCVPCKATSPIVDEISAEMAENVKFIKVDTGKCPKTAKFYGVRGHPTVVTVENGEIVDKMTNAFNKNELKSRIENFLL